MPLQSTSRWLNSRPTRSPSKFRRHRRARWARSRPKTVKPLRPALCSDRSMKAPREPGPNRLPPPPAPPPPPARNAPPADIPLAPSVRKISAESGIDAATVPGSGKDGRVTKGDMLAATERAASAPTPVNQPAAAVQVRAPSPADDAAREERVKMTRLRQTIARRLKDVQNT